MQRLKTRVQFQAVMAGRTIVSKTAHFALHRMELDTSARTPGPGSEGPRPQGAPDTPTGPGSEGSKALFAVREPWIGALIPKRWAKRAVTRNAIKRQIYTVSQTVEPPLPVAAHVVRLRAGFDRKQFESATSDALKRAVRAELQELFCPGRTMIRAVLIALVKGYRLLLSPWLGSSCRFTPTCSAYSLQALESHGAAAAATSRCGASRAAIPGARAGTTRVPAR